MRRLSTLIFVAICFVAGFVLSAPANADAKAKIGIADQKSSMFEDQRFKDLKVKFARISVPWDVLRYDFTTEEIDVWMTRARAQGITPLVTLQRSRVKPHSRPTVQQYTREFKRFKQKYPFVKNYAAWNEPNLEDARRPKLIASYYKAMKSNCNGCKVLAGDLVDTKNMTTWVKQFLKFTKVKPKYWGLHNYVSANRFSTKDTKALLDTVKGSQVWLTETGGLVARRNKSKVKLKQGSAHAAKVTSFILKTWGNNPRIPYLFFYHWDSSSNKDTWDSAFIGSDGKARPSLNILKNAIRARR
ncbi:MAG: hypothetical protein JHC84_04360 [Solirubrobacteraceae bacterium]|nr:hypothetical protein [Solirubrobacteraceae bacterium]